MTHQFVSVLAWVNSVSRREEGQGLVEYALIIALVAIALIVGLGALAGGIDAAFTNISSHLD